ncbi:MAG: hypothetical protein H0V93_00880 [Euzebyales bacterium]|nr:hypothetical protein [Euzebyales bacterium]
MGEQPHSIAFDRRFDLLTAGARTAPARHRTLAATIRWSHDALDDDERVLFARLAVFPGTFDYDAVEAVCRQPPLDRAATVAAFPRLLDKSLVSSHQAGAQQVRYQLLETLRVYASQRPPAAAAASLQERHAASKPPEPAADDQTLARARRPRGRRLVLHLAVGGRRAPIAAA